MQIVSTQNQISRYGTNQTSPQARPEQAVQGQGPPKSDKALSVTISEEAQALRKQKEAQAAERSRGSDETQQANQQQTRRIKTPPVAGKTGQRVDITV